jgi:hypothetical protein
VIAIFGLVSVLHAVIDIREALVKQKLSTHDYGVNAKGENEN